jgi:hypothetical protein
MKIVHWTLAAFLVAAMAAVVNRVQPVRAAAGANMVLTGHDFDYHCGFGDSNECAYFKLMLDLVRNGSTLPVLALDEGSEVSYTVSAAYGSTSFLDVVNPTSSAWTTLPLVDAHGAPLYSALIVASDYTCGGCDNEPTGEAAINARASDIATFFNAGGGIMALAGADNYATYYNFLPISASGAEVTYPFTPTTYGASLGITSAMANCCATHNSFDLPPSGSALKVAETDGAGIAETLVAVNAEISGGGGGVVGTGNTSPTVNAGGPYAGIQGTNVSLSGATASDTDGDTLTYAWSVKISPAGASCTFSDSTALNPTVSCTKLGQYTLELSVNDGHNSPVTSDASLVLFAYPATGRFVLGDGAVTKALAAASAAVKKASVASPPTVTFWSPLWSKLNPLVNSPLTMAPASFRGLASSTSSTPPTCGGTWTGTTAYSTAAPATVPAYMGVIVSSRITLANNQLSGNITRIVIVKTNPGYSNAQGRSGTGTIVGVFCAPSGS